MGQRTSTEGCGGEEIPDVECTAKAKDGDPHAARVRDASVRRVPIALFGMAAWLAPEPIRSQPCVGLPLDPGHHDVGALLETETGYTLLAARYAGSSTAFAWRAHAGGVTRDFPGSFPGDLRPAIGTGLAWVGASRSTCPTIGLEVFDEDPDAFAVEPGDSDRDVSIVSLGWGAGFSIPPDSTRVAGAIIYVIPQIRWVRIASSFGTEENADTDRQIAFESGVTVTMRRFWAGLGARVRYREENDYPLDAVLQARGGVRW